MRKHLWAIVSGVCVVALIAVSAVFIPKVLTNTQSNQEQELIVPGHWWQVDLNDQQLATVRVVWGENITVTQLLWRVCPETARGLPQEASAAYENGKTMTIYWPTPRYDDRQDQVICSLRGVPDKDGMILYVFYLGSRDDESRTMYCDVHDGFTGDRTYRVSLYTMSAQD